MDTEHAEHAEHAEHGARHARADERQRTRRMLGVMNQTLARAQEPRARPRSAHSDAAAVPAAPADHSAERRAHDAERAEIRRKVERVHELSERLAAYELAHRTARANKRRLSSFLVTHTSRAQEPWAPRDAAEAAATYAARATPHVPMGGDAHYEVYYLPRKLLPSQEDALDEQEAQVDDALEQADDDFDRVRDAMHAELTALKHFLEERVVTW